MPRRTPAQPDTRPPLIVEQMVVADLIADPANVRRHNERNIQAIIASLTRFGQQKPIVVDSNGVVRAGNGTLESAARLGWEHIDCVVTDLAGPEAAAYAIADNRTADLAEWDLEALTAILPEFEPDLLDATGFNNDDLAHLLNSLPKPDDPPGGDPDALPATPAKPLCKKGDLWLLGPHRLVIGDATDEQPWAKLMDGEHADCMWTDPPYGINYVGGNHMKTSKERLANGGLTIANDSLAGLPDLLADTFTHASQALRGGAAFYIAHPAGDIQQVFQQAIIGAGWTWSQTLIWVKESMVLGRADYHYRHEPILYGFTPLAAGNGRRGRGGKRWFGDHAQTSVFEVPRPKRSEDHPTMKPVELVEAMLANSCPPRGTVLDPFAGSGSTMIAAQRLGRAARLLELSPGYGDVICRRYQDFTNDLPVRGSTGKPVDFTRRFSR